MTIALITPEPPLNPNGPATGNQVRADHLLRGLAHHGQRVEHLWQDPTGKDGFSDPVSLRARLDTLDPAALLVGYWELLEWLPEDNATPVAVDCVAPRPLEYHFENPAGTVSFLERYVRALARADRILCGNREQTTWMEAWLLKAGLDLRSESPVIVLPLSCDPPDEGLPTGMPDQFHLVSGGRNWPWRNATDWLEALAEVDPNVRIHHVGERLPGVGETVEQHDFMAQGQWRQWLRANAHVGLELADDNLERRASQSFRATALLEAGVPLLLNDFLPLARLVKEYGAGWVVSSPAEAAGFVRDLAQGRADMASARRGAIRLAREQLDYRLTTRPLAEWLDAPRRAGRFTPLDPEPGDSRRAGTAAGETSGHTGGWRRTLALIARGLLRPFQRQVKGRAVVVVTRSDLFPSDHGAAVRILETARGLAREGRSVAIVTADRHHYHFVEDGEFQSRPLPLWLRLLAPPAGLIQGIHLLLGRPTSNGFLYWPMIDPFYGLRAAWAGRQIGATFYMAEFPAYARSARQARLLNGGRVVLVEHNVEYRRLGDQIPDLGEHQKAWFRQMELAACNQVDAVVCVSDRDRDQLIRDGADGARIRVIPHGVDVEEISTATPMDLGHHFGIPPHRPVLVYHGTYDYPPNAEAVVILAEEILPRLAGEHPDIHVLAIGSRPPAGIDHPRIHFAGSLQTLGPALRSCTLAAVPLAAGGGTRMKILDYFAAGLPVVSTSKGCEGIPVTDGQELLIRDGHDKFAAAISTLLGDKEQADKLAQAGQQFARRLDWRHIGAHYETLLQRLETIR